MSRCRPAARGPATLVMLLAALLLADVAPAFAYLKFGLPVNGRTVTIKWDRTPVRYRVFEQGVSGVTAVEFRDAVARAFATWDAVPSATIQYAFEGFTGTSRPGDEDFVNTLGFDNRPELDRVLASTTLLIDELNAAPAHLPGDRRPLTYQIAGS